MFAFIARQPILDREKDLFGYELLFRDGKSGTYPVHSEQKSRYIIEQFYTLGLDEICCNKTSFINFHSDTIITGLPPALTPDSVVIELSDYPEQQSALIDACKHIKQLGFKLAIDDPAMVSGQHSIFPLIDILKVDVHKANYSVIEKNIPRFLQSKIQLVAENVNNHDDFVVCRDLGFDLFQGYFFAKPEATIQRQLPASKMNLVDLMGESSNSQFNLERINQIIERDAALSFLLLKFINNPTINKRYKILSLKHALNYMGEVEIKKFIALLAMAQLGDDKPLELLHMSLVRAKFFDLLAEERGIHSDPPIGFLIGLFSLLDALLDQEMPDILRQLPLTDEINEALLCQSSEFNHYLKLVKAFESGLWMNVIREAKELNIDQKYLHSLYNQSIVWGNGVRQTVSSYFPKKIVNS
ncbi:MAG: EAL domain-containing protein [Alteromonadaceae bacterium]|nr:EAL domain-containing protein [Alteromonadaceae bacterium]